MFLHRASSPLSRWTPPSPLRYHSPDACLVFVLSSPLLENIMVGNFLLISDRTSRDACACLRVESGEG